MTEWRSECVVLAAVVSLVAFERCGGSTRDSRGFGLVRTRHRHSGGLRVSKTGGLNRPLPVHETAARPSRQPGQSSQFRNRWQTGAADREKRSMEYRQGGTKHSFRHQLVREEAGLHPCPTYYLIGAMKCGTSSLNRQIMDHIPSLRQMRKEYYVFPKSGKARLEWYGNNATETFLSLDSTPKYLFNRNTPFQMKELCRFERQPRFVVTLCDPVRRAWSHYRHNVKFGHRKIPEDDDLVSGFHRLAVRYVPILARCLDSQERRQWLREFRDVNRGEMKAKDFCSAEVNGKVPMEIGFSMYLEHLLNWFHVFPENQFLILLQEEWEAHPEQAIAQIARHFSLDRDPNKAVESIHIDHSSISSASLVSKSTTVLLNTVFSRQRRLWESYVMHLTLSRHNRHY